MPFPWKQGDEREDEGAPAFSPEERVMTGDAQDAEYLEPLRKALADILATGPDPYEEDTTVASANAIVDGLTERGWRFVTAKDWRAMCDAWVMQAIR